MNDFGFFPWLLGALIIGGAISTIFQQININAVGRKLHQKFVELGDMTGKSKDEIIAVVGPPTSISELPEGKTLLQWQTIGCDMALRFDGNIFDGITHEYLLQE